MHRRLVAPFLLAALWLVYAAAAGVHPVHALVGFAAIALLWAAWNRHEPSEPDDSTP